MEDGADALGGGVNTRPSAKAAAFALSVIRAAVSCAGGPAGTEGGVAETTELAVDWPCDGRQCEFLHFLQTRSDMELNAKSH